ncbi:DUF3142 domain-containing protein [Cystobacter fuscus]|uniref:DUF3142 domain-containing protein n=1 Tax=Cystobacter fuscus TaxID=43 RepID=UPI002B2DA31C|nr:DUF3142 domain-containing protein [Cystobacter fuscus]
MLAGLLGALASPVASAEGPRVILWAWERPENLRFLNPSQAEVSFLAATVDLTEEAFSVRPRRQPLYLPPGLRPRATVRIEMRQGGSLAHVAPELRQRLVERLVTIAQGVKAAALQIDFDARESETEAYLTLLGELRGRMPPGLPLSITALASWCGSGSWLARAPVDEVVPQLFRMGPDDVRHYERAQRGFAPPCARSVGLALDEWRAPPASASTVYLFNPRPWTATAFTEAHSKLNP